MRAKGNNGCNTRSWVNDETFQKLNPAYELSHLRLKCTRIGGNTQIKPLMPLHKC